MLILELIGSIAVFLFGYWIGVTFGLEPVDWIQRKWRQKGIKFHE